MLIRCFPDRSIVRFFFESRTRKLGDDSTVSQRAFMLALSGKKAIGTTIEKATRRNRLSPFPDFIPSGRDRQLARWGVRPINHIW